ncbi:hypothetical protein EVAR_57850_1 [Eumeta japonica]|uniref:Uncharacterized protein n=1 Tax=Eumeta variegata TaxID=151549 RepID=A0A4C1YVL5_EUMVA|nr:hypothetical protein EVAR_57850_1 [Eumeta japonica]
MSTYADVIAHLQNKHRNDLRHCANMFALLRQLNCPVKPMLACLCGHLFYEKQRVNTSKILMIIVEARRRRCRLVTWLPALTGPLRPAPAPRACDCGPALCELSLSSNRVIPPSRDYGSVESFWEKMNRKYYPEISEAQLTQRTDYPALISSWELLAVVVTNVATMSNGFSDLRGLAWEGTMSLDVAASGSSNRIATIVLFHSETKVKFASDRYARHSRNVIFTRSSDVTAAAPTPRRRPSPAHDPTRRCAENRCAKTCILRRTAESIDQAN